MNERVRLRARLELLVALLTGALAVVTLVWRDWIEAVFGVDPDGHNGALEWAIVGCSLGVAIAFALLARAQWKRAVA